VPRKYGYWTQFVQEPRVTGHHRASPAFSGVTGHGMGWSLTLLDTIDVNARCYWTPLGRGLALLDTMDMGAHVTRHNGCKCPVLLDTVSVGAPRY